MRTYRRGPLLEQAQVFRAGAGQDSEGLRWRDHGHPQRLCAGMGQGEVGMLGTQGTLLGAGEPRSPPCDAVGTGFRAGKWPKNY